VEVKSIYGLASPESSPHSIATSERPNNLGPTRRDPLRRTNTTSKSHDGIDIYAAYGRSTRQCIFVTFVAGVSLFLAWWLLIGNGTEWVGRIFGQVWRQGDERRRLCMAIALAIYFVRLLFTQFVFLKRAMAWKEAAAIGPWILFVVLVLAVAGATNSARFSYADVAGCLLFAFGSWVNSFSEFTRNKWKQRRENRGRLYTLGLFRFSRHPNYLGDLISFSGLCLLAGRWPTFGIPLIMLIGFVFVNIPMLDAHLRAHYGEEFDIYAKRTRKLIPFIY
jgi:protein-S-isoprenylcysteine O-methyltransferase Ste14